MTNESIVQQQKSQDTKNKLFVRDEFLIQLQKFTSQITRTIKQIEGLCYQTFILFNVKVKLLN